jgi:hypothetical protein
MPVANNVPAPRKLYKYRQFDNNALRMLCEANVYYADPRTFNDPLDCDPTMKKGVTLRDFEQLCIQMLNAEYLRNHPNEPDAGNTKADERLNYLRYMTTEVSNGLRDAAARQYYALLLSSEIKRLLNAEMAPRGIFSVSTKWNNSLMWSHYACGHSGICIEFDAENHQCQNLRQVRYSSNAVVEARDLIQWKLHHSEEAESRVFDTYYLAKSSAWSYESEWRDISQTTGFQSMPFRISGIYFGLKCEHWARASIVKLLGDSPGEPDAYYEMERVPGKSHLRRRRLDNEDIAEMKATAIRYSPLLIFEPLPGFEDQ